MNEFGHLALAAAWLAALFGCCIGLFSVSGRAARTAGMPERAALSAKHATLAAFVCSALATGVLVYGFIINDYTNQYVWQFSNREMATLYRITALWGGMDGSMLLWCFMLAGVSAIAAYTTSAGTRLLGGTLAAANSSTLFFLTVVLFFTNPFRAVRATFIPPDGNGLNPLLQNPLMAIHPPMLYAGFTTFAIPFAFCIGALLSNQLQNTWLNLTRRWTLIAWLFLTIGIVLGGAWAYVELGWGGFWAWDPVENASFLPWLVGTAFLHSVMVQQRKGMLKVWNVALVALTYGLTVFGTFLTRSGVVQSVHAFASTDVGWVFLKYLGILFVIVVWLIYLRRKELQPESRIESFVSRESGFVVNNLIFLAIMFATLWGVMFPVFSEAITGSKQTVGVPFYNAVNVPLFLLMLALMVIGPMMAWRRSSFASVWKQLMIPLISALGIGALLIWAGVSSFYALTAYCLCWLLVISIMMELHRGAKALSPAAPMAGYGKVLTRHRDRYAGHLVHIGVAIVTIGITASMAHKMEMEVTLKPGEKVEIGRYSLKFEEIGAETLKNFERYFAKLSVTDAHSGVAVTTLKPELRHYFKNNETTTEVALKTSLRDDLYTVLVGVEDQGAAASFKLYVNPLQMWLWIGTVIMALGTLIIIIPSRVGAKGKAPLGVRSAV
jgi:cytochrome c-type biogenesis protein CcmF